MFSELSLFNNLVKIIKNFKIKNNKDYLAFYNIFDFSFFSIFIFISFFFLLNSRVMMNNSNSTDSIYEINYLEDMTTLYCIYLVFIASGIFFGFVGK
jgi:hypothetical protein